MYFWLTGALSSFLDNAPTYLVFFNTAGGDASAFDDGYGDNPDRNIRGRCVHGREYLYRQRAELHGALHRRNQGVKMPKLLWLPWSGQ